MVNNIDMAVVQLLCCFSGVKFNKGGYIVKRNLHCYGYVITIYDKLSPMRGCYNRQLVY